MMCARADTALIAVKATSEEQRYRATKPFATRRLIGDDAADTYALHALGMAWGLGLASSARSFGGRDHRRMSNTEAAEASGKWLDPTHLADSDFWLPLSGRAPWP